MTREVAMRIRHATSTKDSARYIEPPDILRARFNTRLTAHFRFERAIRIELAQRSELV